MQPQGNLPGDIHWGSFPTNSRIYLPVRQLESLAIESTLTVTFQVLPSLPEYPKAP